MEELQSMTEESETVPKNEEEDGKITIKLSRNIR